MIQNGECITLFGWICTSGVFVLYICPMIKYLLIIIGALALCSCLLVTTIFPSTKHMQNIYGIRNVKTGKGLRPYNAYWWTGNKLILHEFRNWKCMTWQFKEMGHNIYQLKNLSTRKTFEAISSGQAGSGLWQQVLQQDSAQFWEFIRQTDDQFLIRQAETDLYLTISSAKENSNILLMPLNYAEEQLWQLVEQHPWQ